MPGRKYTEEQRREFMALIDRGGSVRAAAVKVGVHPDAGHTLAVDHQALVAKRGGDAGSTVGTSGAGVDLDDALGEEVFRRGALAACLLAAAPAKESSAFNPHHPAQPADAGLASLVDQPCPHIDREIQTQHRHQASKNLQPASQ